MNLSDNIKKIRKEHNLSQEQLAEKLGVSRQSVSKWESGQAYPEMDKVLQICKMFNLNIDDLLNQDIKEVQEKKQSKININKYVDDFLDYITKSIDMFSSLNFKEKITCIIEQIIIFSIIFIILSIIGCVFVSLILNLFFFLHDEWFIHARNIISSLYIIISIIIGTTIFLHVFKVRYLDYFVFIKEDDDTENTNNTLKKQDNKVYIEKKKTKLIIRDPKHSNYRFLEGLLKCALLIVKFIAVQFAMLFSISLIMLFTALIISFLFISTDLVFIGSIISIIGSIIINLILLIIIYSFIFNKSQKKQRLAYIFLISLILIGSGMGLITIGITKFDIIANMDNEYYTKDTINIDMNKDLKIVNFKEDFEFVETNNDNIEIEFIHSKINSCEVFESNTNTVAFNCYKTNDNIMQEMRDVIKNINDKKIIDYSMCKISVRTNKTNIEKLKNNLLIYQKEEEEIQKEINNYENQISNLTDQLYKKDEKIYELEEKIRNLKEELELQKFE